MTVGNPVAERGKTQLMLFTILFSGQATVPPLGHMVLFLLRGISATAHGVSLQIKKGNGSVHGSEGKDKVR